ncbi:MAG: efflux RND transporter periplasmic adaptor subunit [Flavobacteriales bacterium]
MRVFFLFVSIALMLFLCKACSTPVPVEKTEKFSMTDTMMAKCEFTVVQQSDVKNELKLFGKISADNNRQANVYPVVGGIVLKINVELGDYVEQGQVLATVRSSEAADFQRQQLDASANVAIALKNLQVAKDLYTGKLNSEKDVIAAEKELEKANAELNRINEVYNIYTLKGSVYSMTAPISGFIVYKDINQNEELRSDKADIIFSIAQIDEVWALANVNESDISKVSKGQAAEIETISYRNKIFKGKIDRVFTAIDPSTKAMKALIRIPNPDLLLKPEMSATITLKYTENRSMPAVPASSVIFDKNKTWVMVFNSADSVDTRQVEVYRELGEVCYIQSGLKPGEKVISRNGILIYDALND